MKSIVLTFIASTATATGAVSTPHRMVVPRPLIGAAVVPAMPGAITVAANTFVDGTYTGAIVQSIWGPVQVQAVVQKGQIVTLKMLRYPNDRRESLFISQLSLPRLRDEVVRAQSAKVDIISGATVTSEAFVRSLEAALSQASRSTL
jgi:uncharacterized protein with FMN-binding domain